MRKLQSCLLAAVVIFSFSTGFAAVKLEIGDSPVRGSKDAKVTVYEFSDFQCPYCSQVEPTLETLMKKYEGKVKLVYKFLPLEMHPQAMIAAEAAVAAQNQGRFWPMHDLLFSHQNALTKPDLVKYAKQLKLKIKKFKKDMNDPKTAKRIQGDIDVAHAVGFQGTPSFMVGDQKIVGAAPLSDFEAAIDKALK